jgi:hypothetical protein
MVSVIHEISHMDSQDLARPIFHPPVAAASVFWHIRCCRGSGQAHFAIGATAYTDCSLQSPPIRTLLEIFPSILVSSLCMY